MNAGLRAATQWPHAAATAPPDRAAVSRGERRWVTGLFALGLLANALLLWLFYRPQWKSLVGDERFYVPRIRAWAAGDAVAWDPLWPPFYVDAMGLLSRLAGGYHPAVIHAAQVALFFAAAWFFWRIARHLTSPRAAAIALAFFLLTPDLAAYTGFQLAEVLHLSLALAACWLLLMHGRRPLALLLAGVLIGLALASKLLLVWFVPLVLAAVAWQQRGGTWTRLKSAGLVALAIMLTALPFMWRNERLHGAFIIADSTTLNRLIALRDRASRDWQGAPTIRAELDRYLASARTPSARDAIARRQLEEELAQQGPLRTYAQLAPKQYGRLLHHDTYFTTQLAGGPRAAFSLPEGPVSRAVRHWAHATYGLLLFAASVGLAVVRWRRPGGLHLAALFLLYNAAVFLVVITQTRYMVPIYPALMLFAGLGIHAALARARGPNADAASVHPLSPVRAAIGAFAGVALVAVAFPEFWSAL